MISLGGDDKGRCCLVIQRNGRPYQCGLRPLHKGDCEPLDTGPPTKIDAALSAIAAEYPATPVRSGGKVRLPAGLPPGGLKAYCRGAIDYATGLGLDRLARDLGTERAKTESDHDLSRRLAKLLGVP